MTYYKPRITKDKIILVMTEACYVFHSSLQFIYQELYLFKAMQEEYCTAFELKVIDAL